MAKFTITQKSGSATYTLSTGARGPKGDAGASTAADVSFSPTGNIAATDVQAAIAELDSEKAAVASLGTAAAADLLDEDDMASNSSVAVPSQQSVKAYVDANSGTVDNAAVNAAIAEDPAAARGSLDVDSSAPSRDVVIPLEIPVPVGYSNGLSVTHPSVIEIPELLSGYRYWMAYTPYPHTGENENPCIAASNDKITWVVPTGLTNPLDTTANAVALGHTLFSDTEIVWDGTNLHCYYRGLAGTAGEILYRKSSTDGITWGSRVVVYDTVSGNEVISPSIIIDGSTWKMWAYGTGLRYYTSADGLSWTYIQDVSGVGARWHGTVRKYNGVYYLLNNTSNWRLVLYRSYDGLNWESLMEPFVGLTGTSLDSGGNYRSTFLPRGGFPCVFDAWIVGMDGNLDDGNETKTHRVYYSNVKIKEKRAPYNFTSVIHVDDLFLGGEIGLVTTAGATCGQLGWNLKHGAGTGSFELGHDSTDQSAPSLGAGVAIRSGATAGNMTGLQLGTGSSGTRPFNLNRFQQAYELSMVWYYKLYSLSDNYYIGIGSDGLSTTPGRWIGFRHLASEAKLQFYVDDTDISPEILDSTISRSTNWARFEMRFTLATGKWKFRVNSEQWVESAIAFVPSTSKNVNVSMWAQAGGAAAARLGICRFMLHGIIPNSSFPHD